MSAAALALAGAALAVAIPGFVAMAGDDGRASLPLFAPLCFIALLLLAGATLLGRTTTAAVDRIIVGLGGVMLGVGAGWLAMVKIVQGVDRAFGVILGLLAILIVSYGIVALARPTPRGAPS